MDNQSMFITISNSRNIPCDNHITIEIKDNITFILGKNNIGKSNLLRFFKEIGNFIHAQNHPPNQKASDPKGYLYDISTAPAFDKLLNRKSINNGPFQINVKIQFGNYPFELKIGISEWNIYHKIYQTTQFIVDFKLTNNNNILKKENINPLAVFQDRTGPFQKIYELFTMSMYIPSFRTGLFKKTGDFYDAKTGEGFVKEWHNWSGGTDVLKAQKIEELEEELRIIFGYKKLKIKVKPDTANLTITNDEGTFDLEELGGGISHVILCLGEALFKNPAYIFIDEPETGLHPKMQQIFIESLAAKAKYGLIATSHSIGLARSIADDILLLSKDENSKLYLKPFSYNHESTISDQINELGYSSFAEVGGNNILLVEGRTDIKSFHEILRKYKIEHKFIVSSLNGKGLINDDPKKIKFELNELKRLNPNSISVIFDSERSKENEKLKDTFDKFNKICKELGFNVFYTDRHSTENYITQQALDKVLKHRNHKAFGPYENPKNTKGKELWDKNMNWLLFREMNKEDFDQTELGRFISETLVRVSQ